MRITSFVRLALVGALATAGLVGLSSGPASALCPAPVFPDADGRIRELPSGPFVGNNVYSFGADQTALRQLEPGETANFEVKFKNRSDKARGIFVLAFIPGGGDGDFRYRAFLGDTNVSALATHNGPGLKLPGIAPGASTPGLRIEVTMKASTSPTDSVEIHVSGTYKNQVRGCGDQPGIEAGLLDPA